MNILIFCCLFHGSSAGQDAAANEDRYQKVLKMKDDTSKVVAMVDLAAEIELDNKPRAKTLLENSVQLARKLHDDVQLTNALMTYGIVQMNRGNIDTSAILLQQAYKLAVKTKVISDQANILVNLGNIFVYRELFDSATICVMNAMRLYEKLGDEKREATVTVNLAGIYNMRKLLPLAERTARRALGMAIKLKDVQIIGRAAGNLANSFYYRHQFDSTLRYYQFAIPFLKQAGSIPHVQRLYNNMAGIYKELDKYEQAKLYADSNLNLALKIGSPLVLYNAYNILGNVETSLNQLPQSEAHLNQALTYAKMEGGFSSLAEVYKDLAYLCTAQKRWEQAYEYQILADGYRDSVRQESNNETIMELEAKFQAEKKQAKITQLEKEGQIQELTIQRRNTWLAGSLCGLVLVILAGFFAFRSSRQKQLLQAQQIESLQKEKQLEALSGIIKGEETERNRMAQDLHDGLGSLLSGVKLSLTSMKGGAFLSEANTELFSHSLNQLDGAIHEMRRVAHNLMPAVLMENGLVAALRNFAESLNEIGQVKVHFESFNLSERLSREQEIVAYRMVQEAVNNALKHAEASRIIIQISKVENQIQMEVEDDGKGFDRTRIAEGKTSGLQNLKNRAAYLKGSLEIRSEMGNGTTISISFPVG